MGRKAMKGLKVPVSTRALMQRINRTLRVDEEMVKATRGEKAKTDLGDFYRLDLTHNAIIETHVDLEEMAKEYKVLQPFEAWDAEEE